MSQSVSLLFPPENRREDHDDLTNRNRQLQILWKVSLVTRQDENIGNQQLGSTMDPTRRLYRLDLVQMSLVQFCNHSASAESVE